MTVTDYSGLSKVAPEKSLLEPMKKTSGRNNYGRITVRHHGGGNRTKYRIIDFKRDKVGMNATVQTIEYDPNRSAFIALTSSPATRFPLRTFRSVPSSTASSSTPARAPSWSARPATWRS